MRRSSVTGQARPCFPGSRARARLALERQVWLDEVQRVTKPLDWRRENDPFLRALDALNLERQERMGKTFPKSSG